MRGDEVSDGFDQVAELVLVVKLAVCCVEQDRPVGIWHEAEHQVVGAAREVMDDGARQFVVDHGHLALLPVSPYGRNAVHQRPACDFGEERIGVGDHAGRNGPRRESVGHLGADVHHAGFEAVLTVGGDEPDRAVGTVVVDGFDFVIWKFDCLVGHDCWFLSGDAGGGYLVVP